LLCYVALSCGMLRFVVQCYAILCNVMLCCARLRCVVQYCAILRYPMLRYVKVCKLCHVAV